MGLFTYISFMALIDFSANPSLNEIVSSLAARVDKPYDVGLQDELKHIVNYKRQKAIHDWLISNPANWIYFLQSIIVETERVPASECEEFPTDCWVVRTVCEIPAPLRDGKISMGFQLFEYVGHISGFVPYSYMQMEYLSLDSYNRYTGTQTGKRKWYWRDGRVYIVVDKGTPPDPVQIRGVFENALDLQRCTPCDEGESTCINDNDPYPIPGELLDDIVRSILSVELRVGAIPNEQLMEEQDSNVDTVSQTAHVEK